MDNNRPEHSPEGYEWLPDAYARDVKPHGFDARESVRRALAEGQSEALLRTPIGERHPIPQRMWDKEPVAEKVFPWFENGWMRMRLQLRVGPYVKGWVFIRNGALPRILGQADRYHTGVPGRPSIGQLIVVEFKRRSEAEERSPTLHAEAKVLQDWAKSEHSEAPTPTVGTIENQIRSLYRQATSKKSTK